jgi:hypothetical protein
VLVVNKIKSKGIRVKEAQEVYIKCFVKEIVKSYIAVFIAKEARKGKLVIDFKS